MPEEKKDWVYYPEGAKLVTKPWGNKTIDGVENVGEVWLNYRRSENVGDEQKRYVMKLLYVKAGTRMSFQYHVNKLETNFLLDGKIEVFLENEKGEMEQRIIEPYGIWTIPCGRKHRARALTDLVMIEASTPEVDDVIRIEDDTGRGDGRIESEHISVKKYKIDIKNNL